LNEPQKSKIIQFKNDTVFTTLSEKHRYFIEEKSVKFGFSFQEIKQLIDIATDLEMWQEGDLSEIWNEDEIGTLNGKDLRQKLIRKVLDKWDSLKQKSKDYTGFIPQNVPAPKLDFVSKTDESIILGNCPVASEKTRCCNLLTLDTVKNCGFDCSYCSIQSFYTDGKIYLHEDLRSKLNKLELDPKKIYHIGTGQSSDSLMWGNKDGILDDIFEFANKNKNVVLELKTKSNAIGYFRRKKIPSNVIVTWSLNTDVIIGAEEHHTATLRERLKAAKDIADMGILVGFHFHPIVEYKGWENEYHGIIDYIQKNFRHEEVALISLGTLTFIKPVIKQLRKRKLESKILQMPLTDAEGKFSYPLNVKREIFSSVYNRFSEKWKKEVYFYMCMEDKSLWKDIFGKEYKTNEEFESDMNAHYMGKIKWLEDQKKNIKKSKDKWIDQSTYSSKPPLEQESNRIVKLSYFDRIKLYYLATHPDHGIKTTKAIVKAIFDFSSTQKNYINPDLINSSNYFFNKSIQTLVKSTRLLSKSIQRKYIRREENPFFWLITDTICSWDIESIQEEIFELKKESPQITLESCAPLIKLIYYPLLKLSKVNRKNDIEVAIKYRLYPLLLMFVSSKVYDYNTMFRIKGINILNFLDLNKEDLITYFEGKPSDPDIITTLKDDLPNDEIILQEKIESIIKDWYLFIDELIIKNYIGPLQEYCRQMESSPDFPGTDYAKRITSDILWLKTKYINPNMTLSLPKIMQPRTNSSIPKLFESVLELKDILGRMVEERFCHGEITIDTIRNQEDESWFEIDNNVSKRIKSLLKAEDKKLTNRILILYTYEIVEVLNETIQSPGQQIDAKSISEFFRSEESRGIKPIYSVSSNNIFFKVKDKKLKINFNPADDTGHIDLITGFFGKNQLSPHLQFYISKYLSSKNVFSIIYINIHGFKTILPANSSIELTSLLIEAVQSISSSIRLLRDIPFRTDQDNIYIILPETNSTSAIKIAKQIFLHKHIKNRFFIGITTYKEGMDENEILSILENTISKQLPTPGITFYDTDNEKYIQQSL
jgi:spore photoproduct lyase